MAHPETPSGPLTVGQVARLCGLPRTRVQAMCDDGWLRAERSPFDVRLIARDDAERLRERLRAARRPMGGIDTRR